MRILSARGNWVSGREIDKIVLCRAALASLSLAPDTIKRIQAYFPIETGGHK